MAPKTNRRKSSSAAAALANQCKTQTRGNVSEADESSDSNISTPDDALQRAIALERRSAGVLGGSSAGSSRPKSITLSRSVNIESNAAEVRLLTTNQEVTSVSSISSAPKKHNGMDKLWMACEKARDDARKVNYDIKTFVRENLFPRMKFISGPNCMEMGQLPSRMVLRYLNVTDPSIMTEKWGEKKRMVREALNKRRGDCTTAIKKKFLGKIVLLWIQQIRNIAKLTLFIADEYAAGNTDLLYHEEVFGPLNEGTREYRTNDLYMIFTKVFVPCIIPKKVWKTSCYKKKLCDYVTASDEAFIIWTFTNYGEWWLKKFNNPVVKEDKKGKDKDVNEKDEEEDKVGMPLWTSGGKCLGDGRTAKGCGVTAEGLEVYFNILTQIIKERKSSKQFDIDFLNSKLAEVEPGTKVVDKKRKVRVVDEYNEVHSKLMRAMAEEEGSDMDNWDEE